MANEKKDYGVGIRRMRFFEGRLFEPRNLDTDSDE